MASKSVGAQAKGAAQRAKFQNNSSWEQATFIQRELTPVEIQACKDWDENEESLFAHMVSLCDVGYKITFRLDEYNGGFGCWLLPAKDDPDNSGLILTGRGSAPWKAFKQALYKHYVLFTEQWPRDGDRRGTGEIDD
jgi:hypothetical protein